MNLKNKQWVFPLAMIAVFIFLSFGCSKDIPIEDKTEASDQKSLQYKLQQLVDSALKVYKEVVPDYPGGLAMKVISKKGTFFVSSGMGENMTDATHFRAASNTKTFTATAILLLYQQGRLDITHKISDTIPGTNELYIPDIPEFDIPYKESITILELLQHRAGVFDVSNDPIPDTVSVNVPYKGMYYTDYIDSIDPTHTYTFDEMVSVVAQCRLFYFQPNTAYHYSNTGFSLLGKIIERVSGKTYHDFLMEDVIIPMGLKNTSMPVSGADQMIPIPYISGYLFSEDGSEDVSVSNISSNVAEGNVITTPYDLSYFLKKLLSGQGVLNPHVVNVIMMNCIQTNPNTAGGYGCGLTYTNNLGYGHNGAHEGYLSQMTYDPQADFTVVVFTNCWNVNDGMNSIAYQLIHLIENNCYNAKYICN